jgi:hypothetical protein
LIEVSKIILSPLISIFGFEIMNPVKKTLAKCSSLGKGCRCFSSLYKKSLSQTIISVLNSFYMILNIKATKKAKPLLVIRE